MSGSRRSRSNRGDRSPFNSVIVLRSPSGAHPGVDDEVVAEEWSYELYYDDDEGYGLRPLPPTMSEFLMGSGFDRLLDQLVQIEDLKLEKCPVNTSTIPILYFHGYLFEIRAQFADTN
ncbi:hypothetical protein K7X08_024949 [Anisodus acutangulus]|uniref:Uncharacterized protein n=1 Tax=Anisodus acutangulus TaxID=402998 RepID=A0A9Q1RDE8_9SOLA|nr:hypothetical protein K7X08_024949 [Anisodus acutangulus]